MAEALDIDFELVRVEAHRDVERKPGSDTRAIPRDMTVEKAGRHRSWH